MARIADITSYCIVKRFRLLFQLAICRTPGWRLPNAM